MSFGKSLWERNKAIHFNYKIRKKKQRLHFNLVSNSTLRTPNISQIPKFSFSAYDAILKWRVPRRIMGWNSFWRRILFISNLTDSWNYRFWPEKWSRKKNILIFHKTLQSCWRPVQKNLPTKAELTWQVSRYLWRG